MADKEIRDICDKVADRYASLLKNDNSMSEMLKMMSNHTAHMVADILIEYNRQSEKLPQQSDEQPHQQ